MDPFKINQSSVWADESDEEEEENKKEIQQIITQKYSSKADEFDDLAIKKPTPSKQNAKQGKKGKGKGKGTKIDIMKFNQPDTIDEVLPPPPASDQDRGMLRYSCNFS